MNIEYSESLSASDFSKLRKSVGFHNTPERHLKSALDKSDYVVSAIVNGTAIGMARLISDGMQVLIMDVIVEPKYQGCGVGKCLMQKIRQYIDSMDNPRVIANLITDDRKALFYENLGYQKTVGMRLCAERND